MENMHSKRSISRKKRAVRPYAILSALALLIAGCAAPDAGQPLEQLQPRAVQTEAVSKQTIGSPIEQVANVLSGTVWDVVPKVSGEVDEVLKERGEYVEKGEVLFTIVSTDAESALRKSELALINAEETLKTSRQDLANNLESAKTNYENVLKEYNKIRNDFDDGLVTQYQVDQIKDQVDAAKRNLDALQDKLDAYGESTAAAQIQVESARVAVEDAKRALEYYRVKAPGSGILTDFNLEAGQTVSAAAGRVGQIQQVDPIKLQTELTETNYRLVKDKQELVYYNPDDPEQKNTARISYLAPVMSAATKTYTLELEIPNPGNQLQPGSRYMVQLTTEAEEQVLAVPVLSVIREESNTYVFVKEGDAYRKKPIKLGRVGGEYQEVLEGLKEGDRVVVTGQNTLKDGQTAEDAQVEPSSSPAAQ